MKLCATCAITILLTLGLSGCGTTGSTVGPAVLQLGVSTGTAYSLTQYPTARPGVAAAALVVCSVANGTNVSPAAIVQALDAYGPLAPESVLIVNSALSLYEIIYAGLTPTNSSPYAIALCNGLNQGLAFGQTKSMPSPKGAEQFPQMRFK